MKILIIQDYLRSGGTERQSILLSKMFYEAGNKVFLMTFRPKGPLFQEIKDLIKMKKFFYSYLQPFDMKIDYFAPFLKLRIKKIKPNIVICMGRMSNKYSLKIQKDFPNLSVIGTVRTGKKLSKKDIKILSELKAIITNSKWWKRELSQKQNISKNKIEVIYNNIVHDFSILKKKKQLKILRNSIRKSFKIEKDTCIFLNVANFHSNKNQYKLIQYCSKLKKLNYNNWRLWFIGDGKKLRFNKNLARKLGISDKIMFLGSQVNPVPFYISSDVAVSSSLQDSQPNFLSESQYSGLPVIAYDYKGVKECFLDGKTGYLVKNVNVNSLSKNFIKYMIELMQDLEKRKKMSNISKENAQKIFSKENKIEKYYLLFKKIMN
jgi:glycosyltransferase involved in cell wall biosynthesis